MYPKKPISRDLEEYLLQWVDLGSKTVHFPTIQRL